MDSVLGDEYVSVPEAAVLLHVSQSTIWRWIDQGTLPAVRVGRRRVRLRKADLTTVMAPARAAEKNRGEEMAQTEQEQFGPLTSEEQEQWLTEIEAARKLRVEQLKSRGGRPFSPSYEVLDELRDERTRDIS